MLIDRSIARPAALISALVCAVALAPATACKTNSGYGGGPMSPARKWIESPTNGSKEGNFLKIPSLGVQLEIPETRYVFKNCFEPTHSASEPNGWIPVLSCSSAGQDAPSSEDEWEAGASEDSTSEDVALTFYITPKERPIDERAVAFFKNKYKSEGFNVQEISYNDAYHDKAGIYMQLQVMDEEGLNPQQEIVQFIFPYDDVLFIARMENAYGDSRTTSMATDWSSIMWYFKFEMPGKG